LSPWLPLATTMIQNIDFLLEETFTTHQQNNKTVFISSFWL